MDDNQFYPIGLSGKEYLTINNEVYTHSEIMEDGCIRIVECNSVDKGMKVKSSKRDLSEWIEMDLKELKRSDIIDISENGERWEGDSFNGFPFGYGCIYNKENHLIYNGFMIGSTKIGFGSVFYEDVGIVEYSGSFYQNKKYGYGKLYDKKNNLSYQGEWVNDKPFELENIKMDRELKEEAIHFGIRELIIEDDCESDIHYFRVKNLKHLERLVIGNRCAFSDVCEFVIENCDMLNEVNIGFRCFTCKCNGDFVIENCKKLNLLIVKKMSFNYFKGKLLLNNLPQFSSFITEYESFSEISKVTLSNLPQYTDFTTGDTAFYKTTNLHLLNIPQLTSFAPNNSSFVFVTDLSFENFPNLTRISIGENSFSTVPCLIISNLPKLRFFYVSGQTFGETQQLVFSNLPQLNNIGFGYQSFYTLHEFILEDLPNLTELSTYYSFPTATYVRLSNLPLLHDFTADSSFDNCNRLCLENVPFTDGDFYYDNLAFHSLHEDCIEADEQSQYLKSCILENLG